MSRAFKCGINVRANIFTTDAVEKTGFVHHEKWLSVRAAENEMFAALAKFVMKIFEGVETGGIHGEHFSHSKNEDLRFLARALEGGLEFVDSAEEESAEDAEDENAIRNFFADE